MSNEAVRVRQPPKRREPRSRARTPEVSIRKAAEKFRRAREDAGLTLRELGEKAGLSPSTILKVESSQVVPSIAVCIRLADALNRKVSWFIEDEEASEDVRLIRHGRGRVATPPGSRIEAEVVAEPLRNPRMEAFLLTIRPGGGSGDDSAILYRGEEIVYGVRGQVRFEIRGEPYVVRPGDVLHFKGDIPHAWGNDGSREARILVVCAFGYER